MGKDRLTGSSHRHTHKVGQDESSGLSNGQKTLPGDVACVITIDTCRRGHIPWSMRDSQQQSVLCPCWVLLPGDIRCPIRCHLLLHELTFLAGPTSSHHCHPCPALSLPPVPSHGRSSLSLSFSIQYNPSLITLLRNPVVPRQEDHCHF